MKSIHLLTFCFLLSASIHASQNGLLNEKRLAGELNGYRPQIEEEGVVFSLQSISDILANTTGGASQGGTYAGLLHLSIEANLKKILNWEGASFKNTYLWVYGEDVSKNFSRNAFTASSIAGVPALRCYELWIQQNLFKDLISLRAGLIPFDTEFMTCDNSSIFVGNACNPIPLSTFNFPNGGPQYPTATPALRFAMQPTSCLTVRTIFMQANPLEQENNPHNFNWNFGSSGGLLNINELSVSWNSNSGAKGLPGTAKIGCWFEKGKEPQNESKNNDEFSFGSPRNVSYDSGFYGISEQQLYIPRIKATDRGLAGNEASRCKNPQDVSDRSEKGLASFVQIGMDPQSISSSSFYCSSGLIYTGLIPFRDLDKLGISFAYAEVSQYLQNKIREMGIAEPSFEAVAEMTYSIRMIPSITIQPDIQYILHPSGTQQYRNALIVGTRVVLDF